jgi:hypothetical protein
MLERADQMIFQAWASLHPDPLIQAGSAPGNNILAHR